MATSLLGKADATIADMSLKEAMADVTPNLKSVYDEKVKTQALLQTKVEAYFDGLNKENNALSDMLDETLNTTVEGADNEVTQDMYFNFINPMRDEIEGLPNTREGDLQRAKIKAKLNRLKDNAATTSQTLIDLKTKVLNQDYNVDGTGGPTLAFLNQIANGSVKRSISDDGRIVFTNPATGEKVDEKGLRALIAAKDPNDSAGFNKVTVGANANGKTGKTFEDSYQSYVNDYYKSFKTKTGFADNIHTRQEGLEFTFAEYLSGKGDGTENMKIFDALRKIMPDQIPQDKTGDGKITAEDFASPENAIKLIKSLTQINNPESEGGFNFQLAKQVAAEFYTDNIARKEHQDGMTIFNRASNRGGGGINEEGGTGFLTTKKGVNSGSLGYYVFPDFNSAKFAYDQFNLASKGEKAKFSIGKAQYVFDVKGDNAYKWIEKTAGGDQRVLGTTTETIGPDGFGITDPDFLKINNFEGSSTNEIEKFEGLGNTKQIGLTFENFQQDEYNFTTSLQEKYDLSNFVIKDTPGITTSLLGFGESFGNAIDIVDKSSGRVIYRDRTNYTDNEKAQAAADRFNEFLTKYNIKLKDPTAGMSAKERIEYYQKNPK
jgi:hypothetical protein